MENTGWGEYTSKLCGCHCNVCESELSLETNKHGDTIHYCYQCEDHTDPKESTCRLENK
jgi:hypothetical protein